MNSAKTNHAGADFKALDACHQQIAEHLDRLAALVEHLLSQGVDAHAQGEARSIESFFSETSQRHHLDEEAKVFPPLLASSDEALVATVRMLQQDHGWIEEDWIELAPQLRAIASGNNWFGATEFQHNVEVFLALCRGHIALEETLIYPESKANWAQAVAARVAREAKA